MNPQKIWPTYLFISSSINSKLLFLQPPLSLSQQQKRFTVSLISLSYAVCDEDHLIYLWFKIRRSVSLNSQLQMSADKKRKAVTAQKQSN